MFIRAPADGRTHFFAMSLNRAGNRITFVDPPAAVVNSLGLSLRTAFPHRIANEQATDDGILTIWLKSGVNCTFHTDCRALHYLSQLVLMVALLFSNGR